MCKKRPGNEPREHLNGWYHEAKFRFLRFVLFNRGLLVSHPADCHSDQADFQGTCVVLVGSGGGGQPDIQDAEIQDDADRYSCGCHSLNAKSR